ncbi:heat shock 70 kDa protein-like [Zophobas morio]|uniref:heat shock 70 kDa protein-like n=1 Tax=Zophobas morio TaxID=2755281 RepID=UPI003082E8DC
MEDPGTQQDHVIGTDLATTNTYVAQYMNGEVEILENPKGGRSTQQNQVIGIDLGTTNTCVAYYANGKVEILENSEGKRLTPSYVFFPKKSTSPPIVGQRAKRMGDKIPSNGIYETKRFVGKSFNAMEPHLQHFSFNVENKLDSPVIRIERDNDTLELTPQEISSLILKKIKKDVEDKLGDKIDKAVITVPACFNTTQREVTLAAANQAGFTVLKLFNEPTAAALSYFFKKDDENDCYALVYDLGGSTFDVSILKRTATNIDVICVDGDTELGGNDFDKLIFDYVCEKMEEYNYNPRQNLRQMRRLQEKCEDAKKNLSTGEETSIILDGFIPNSEAIEVKLKRKDFELKAHELIKRTINIVNKCLNESQIPKNQIQHVILSGGSSRIPIIQKELSKYFDGKTLSKFNNLDECVAEGAALQAAMLTDNNTQKIKKLAMTEVVPLSLGIGLWVDRMRFVIKKDAPIPTTNTIRVLTSQNQQKTANFEIYEGERLIIKKNRYLGSLELENITPAPPGQCKLSITFSIDHNGVLEVKATEQINNNMKRLNVKYTRGGRSESEIEDTLKDAERNREEDELFDVFSKQKLYLLQYCEGVKYNLGTLNIIEKHQDVYRLCENIQTKGKTMDVDDKDELEYLIREVENQCAFVVKSCKFKNMPVRPLLS